MLALDYCKINQINCLNNGKCENRHGKAVCVCTPPYKGEFCEIKTSKISQPMKKIFDLRSEQHLVPEVCKVLKPCAPRFNLTEIVPSFADTKNI